MKTHLKKPRMVRGNRPVRGLFNCIQHGFLQTRETVPLKYGFGAASTILFFKSPVFGFTLRLAKSKRCKICQFSIRFCPI